LSSNNALKIEYSATTDQATPINLTNHCYFNLSGGKDSTILDHELQIIADRFTEVNDVLIPTGKLPEVTNTAMDFCQLKKIGKDIGSVKGGYDHNWVLNKKTTGLESIASLYHAGSGRMMEVFTTEPGLQFYSGNFLDGSLRYTANNATYPIYAGLCLEAQHFPDSPNQPSFPNTILQPGEKYTQTTIYQFSTR
ncbi:MAG TPA: aldose epimerase family protein, partial [Ferruginibacter sp.]|nr:aldose epimerase family protein [Ferruginibacter sp.]